MFIIQRNDGMYVSRAHSAHSYTNKLQNARVFDSHAAACSELCIDNEKVLSIEEAMQGLK